MTTRKRISQDNPRVDLNPFVDMAFQLIIFFMLTTSFKVDEPAEIAVPSSASEIKLPENDVVILSVDKDGKVYFDVDGKFTRERLIKNINSKFNLGLQESEFKKFSLLRGFGLPLGQLKAYLSLKDQDRKLFPQTGIPDEAENNELNAWIVMARMANPKARFAIKADRTLQYPKVKLVIETLRANNINRFNLLTDLRK
ncbi:MAG: biopolymer transporter ExbD [Cytophagales bacterium]